MKWPNRLGGASKQCNTLSVSYKLATNSVTKNLKFKATVDNEEISASFINLPLAREMVYKVMAKMIIQI